ncbi:MAG TPA: FHA domain-containing protein [Pyrinomonadaceae bacterium]|nr:FHA domain-containing protein [Pyrinomonadaceae bacterium]
MNIILAEERSGKQLAEKSFDKETILVGREAAECDIAFEKEIFPMVSRKHAEIRWHNDQWYLNDLGSSYGTYLNNLRISAPHALSFGDLIQIGTDGPMLRVVWFEVVREPSGPIDIAPADSMRVEPKPEEVSSAKLESADDSRPPIQLGSHSIWLGRDPSCDVVIEPNAAMVSRNHAHIGFKSGEYVVADNNSFNGTFVNDRRLSEPVKLQHGDEIRLGTGGPTFRFSSTSRSDLATAEPVAVAVPPKAKAKADPKTMVFKLGNRNEKTATADAELIRTVPFGAKNELTIGRAESNDIPLDGLQISNHHAKLIRSGNDFLITDLNSTNGVFVNGERISKRVVSKSDDMRIGSFSLRIDQAGNIGVFDPRSKMRVDAVNLSSKAGKAILLDGISFSILPNEFVGVLGPSGAGKSTLIELMNGVRAPKSGNILVNNLDLNRNLNSLRQSIGYVPQEDIIHRELSVERTLTYVAKLRLSSDVSSRETRQIVDEVLDVTGLTERKKLPVNKLSGGERKRVSIAVELITKPSVIYLDEPTSGLDPSSEEKIMKLFREISESGRTVVMTTHAMENVRLFDKIVVLMSGRLVYFGPPDDALKHFEAASFKELFDRLDSTVEGSTTGGGKAAESLQQNFQRTTQYKKFVEEPLQAIGNLPTGVRPKKIRLGLIGSIRQFLTLSRRYFEVFRKDRLNLFILLAQAPVIAILTFFAMGAKQPRDFVYFILSLVAIWFGTSGSAREIVRERPIYKRERMFNLGILPYVASKLFVLGIIVGIQCLMLFIPLKFFDLVGLMPMPGEYAGIPQLWTMLLTAGVGIGLGLLVSAIVRTSELATTLVPLILIPQILLSGIIGVPAGVNKVIGLTMPSAWSFDTMKRFSTLDTLEPEGADPKGKTKGLGLYKEVENENDKAVADAKKRIEEIKRSGSIFDSDGEGGLEIKGAAKLPENLSNYVTFLHPWMNEVLNQVVLMLMFGILMALSLIVLRLKDIR